MGISVDGKELLANLLTNNSSNYVTYFGWGAGSPAFNFADSALGSELFPSGNGTQRNAVFSTSIMEAGQNIFTGRLEDDQLSTGSIIEIGLFDSISGGTLFTRNVGTGYLLKSTGLRVIVEHSIEVGRRIT